MFRALYGQFRRFLAWLNGGGYSVKDVENQRRDTDLRRNIDSSYRGGGGDMSGGGGIGG